MNKNRNQEYNKRMAEYHSDKISQIDNNLNKMKMNPDIVLKIVAVLMYKNGIHINDDNVIEFTD